MKLTKIVTPLLAGVCLLAISTDANAQGRRGKMVDKIFAKLDANKDGKITKAEAGDRWKRLSRADKNNDGAVTKAELAAAGKKRRKKGGKRKKRK